ncbi:SUKH-4 family immunity protein [Streptomyces sp. NPDC014894]|uniref:SUKH-4 family immunity protein n=1 Tax=Streptomyces sp. NPDC014894 TaxID=3364931 RepID=UPI0036F8C20B
MTGTAASTAAGTAGTAGTAAGAPRGRALVTVPAARLHPAIVHDATRKRLTERGLPAGPGLMRFDPLLASRAVTVPELLDAEADPADLDAYIAGLVVVGRLTAADEDPGTEAPGPDGGGGYEDEHLDRVVLDGVTGRVFTLYLYEEHPEDAELLPLAPSLAALARLLAAAEELGVRRGAAGPDAVADASARFLRAVGEEEWAGEWGPAGEAAQWDDPVPAFWRVTALIRPLALIAAPGGGLLMDLPAAVLEAEFGAGAMVRADPARLPAALEHGPTRRFLTGPGLPADSPLFRLAGPDDLLLPAPGDREPSAGAGRTAVDAGRPLHLGFLIEDNEVVIDGRTGEVHLLLPGEDRLTPLNGDVSALAFTLWTHHRERTLDQDHGFAEEAYEQLADAMERTLASVDPVACRPTGEPDDWRPWPELFHDEAGGVL